MNTDKYAGFWVRLGAALIDTVVLLIVLAIPLSLIYGAQYWADSPGNRGLWDFVLSHIFPIIATIWFWTRFGGTPGKMVLKLKIVDAKTGKTPTVGQSVLRYVGYFISAIPLLLGYVWVGIDKKKQGFHDKIAGTLVVHDQAV